MSDEAVPKIGTHTMKTQLPLLFAAFLAPVALFLTSARAGEDSCHCDSDTKDALRVTLMGEFEKVGVYPLHSSATLVQAIATAGGFTKEADPRNVRVVRTSTDHEVERFTINVEELLEGKSADWNLQDRDLIVAGDAKETVGKQEETASSADAIVGAWVSSEFGGVEGAEEIGQIRYDFRPDGSFQVKAQGMVLSGSYTVEGGNLQLTIPDLDEPQVMGWSIADGVLTLRDPEDDSWVKFRPDVLTMKQATEYPMGEFPQSVALGDLDGDGRLDVMTANRRGDSVSVRLGLEGGTFGDAVAYRTDPEPLFVRAADLDGDEVVELLTGNLANTVTIFRGEGGREVR